MIDKVPDGAFEEMYHHFGPAFQNASHSEHHARVIERCLGLPKGASILDLPCGQGRISKRLALQGYSVTGIDIRAAYIREARIEGADCKSSLQYACGDMLKLCLAGEFDAVIIWYSSIFIVPDTQMVCWLTELRRFVSASPFGTIVIEQNNPEFLKQNFPSQADAVSDGHTRMPNAHVLFRSPHEYFIDYPTYNAERRVRHHWIVACLNGRIQESQFSMRVHTVDEWESMLAAAGFRNVQFLNYDCDPIQITDSRLVVKARS